MALPLAAIDAITRAGETLIDRLIPDTNAAAKAKQEWSVMTYQGDLANSLAQLEVNKEEAKSDSLFVSGWRPAAGWICVAGLGVSFLLLPLLEWASTNFGWISPPKLELDVLLTLLGGMLGLTGVRSFEKVKGVAREAMVKKAPAKSAEAEDPYIG